MRYLVTDAGNELAQFKIASDAIAYILAWEAKGALTLELTDTETGEIIHECKY